ncbi:hypothetical protein B4U80_00107 [Leptotrombidium deliense]|uniref:Uncharacterized protein n=1 Tax=Leptotrombidium deliense TaxID=299467 RepID=A0A443SIG4_9ACAR|nr:hypothetical protein B4U80_00107 [Leptotrombidium deliense]
MSSYLITCKIRKKFVLVGDALTGKSCLTYYFLNDEYVDRVMITPTVVNDYLTEVHINEKAVALALWDTGGEAINDDLRQFVYPGVDLFLICFSVDMPSSLHNVAEKWVPHINKYCPEVPFVVVATKMDKKSHDTSESKLMGLNWKRGHVKHGIEGKLMAEKIGAAAYFECSAKVGEGVKEMFHKCVKLVLKEDDTDKHYTRREYCCVQQ